MFVHVKLLNLIIISINSVEEILSDRNPVKWKILSKLGLMFALIRYLRSFAMIFESSIVYNFFCKVVYLIYVSSTVTGIKQFFCLLLIKVVSR